MITRTTGSTTTAIPAYVTLPDMSLVTGGAL